jgi:putative SOS response-associated peptidase YedK
VATRGQAQNASVDSLKNKEPFAFAELWDSWRNPELGDMLNAFTIITTNPNSLLKSIHNRVPVIFDDMMDRQWLEHDFGLSSMQLAAVMRPWPAEYMEAWDVSTLVNAPENDSTTCILPAAQSQTIKGQLPLV